MKKKKKNTSIIDKIKSIIKSHKTETITALIVFGVGLIGIILFIILNNSSIKEVKKEQYELQYDSTWMLKKNTEDTIELKHKGGSKITIDMTKLKDDYKYSSIDELIDEIIYSINDQNKDYSLISKKKGKLTKYQYDGYKILYENKDEQIMICAYKKGDKLVIIRYEATDDYFDILLDSVQNIIYNLNVKDSTYNLTYKIEVDTDKTSYSKNDEFDKSINKSKEYEVANYNYKVKYSIPTLFELRNLDSTYTYLSYSKTTEDKVDIRYDVVVSPFSYNIYEYVDKDNSSSVYSESAYYKKNEENKYSDFNESLSKLDTDRVGYIYLYSYKGTSKVLNSDLEYVDSVTKYENAIIAYALDNNHILKIKIETTNGSITEKLVNSIKILDVNNYASNVSTQSEEGNLIGKLQRFKESDRTRVDEVTIKIPDKYVEIDKKNNMYRERHYGLNYDEDLYIYDYNVSYELANTDIDGELGIIGSKSTSYGESSDLSYSGDFTVNNKNFAVYDGGYTDISGIMFTNINRIKYYVNRKVLFYQMPDKGVLVIEIDGNGKEITDEIINEVTNFTIDEKEL